MSEKAKLLLDIGFKFVGAVTSETIKAIPGGGLIVAAGSEIIGTVVNTILGDVADRSLSNREQLRVGASANIALHKINKFMENGQPIRTDDKFFANNEYYRSGAEEALEGVLQKCKAEHEEKKIPYISNIFAKAVFTSVSLEEINHVIKVAEILTYRQLCILAVIKENQINDLQLLNKSESSSSLLFDEVLDLDKNNLIYQISESDLTRGLSRDEFKEKQSKAEFTAILGSGDITPAGLILSGLGKLVYDLMILDEIPDVELEDVIKALK